MNQMNNNTVCIEHEDMCYTIERRDEFEHNNHFYKRIEFIKAMKPKTQKEYNEVIRLSKIYQNMITLKCRYPPELEKKIYSLVSKIEI